MFVCPVCNLPLEASGGAYVCGGGHTYDISRRGYVNLSRTQTARTHGDDKKMAAARRDFLDGGWYSRLRERLCDTLKEGAALDIGCGVGYYLEGMSEKCECAGVDLSKAAVDLACRRKYVKKTELAVAGCDRLPLADGSVQNVTSVFAPIKDSEAARVLADGGRLIRVVAGSDHLIELKREIYEKAQRNPPPDTRADGFTLKSAENLRYRFRLTDGGDIRALFTMTPYYYRTSPADADKLYRLRELDVTAHFYIFVYEK